MRLKPSSFCSMSAYVVKLLRAYEVMRVSVAEWHSAADCKLSGKRSTGSWEKRKWNSESSNKETSSEQIGLLNIRIIIWPLLPAFPIYSRTSSPPKKAHFEKASSWDCIESRCGLMPKRYSPSDLRQSKVIFCGHGLDTWKWSRHFISNDEVGTS